MTTSQQFLDQLADATAPAYQSLIQGIADFHRAQGYLSAKQANCVRISAHKAGMDVPPSLVIRDPQPAGQHPQTRQSAFADDEAGPFPDHDQTIVRSGVKMRVDVGDKLVNSNGIVTGKSD